MDKAVQKVLFAAAGIPVVAVRGRARARVGGGSRRPCEARAAHLGYPLFAKPAGARLLGRDRARSHEPPGSGAALETALRLRTQGRARAGGRRAPARSSVAVLGNDDPVASVAGEIVPRGHEFYDYEAKYLDEHGAELLIPADIAPETLEEIQRLAVAAFRAIDGAGMARVDFFLTPDGRRVPERGEHDPGVHEHLDVPEAVGGIGVCATPSSSTG